MNKMAKTIGKKSRLFVKGAIAPVASKSLVETYMKGFLSLAFKSLAACGLLLGAVAMMEDSADFLYTDSKLED